MERVLQHWRSLVRHRYLPAVVTGLTLLVFGAAILLITQQLRGRIREQIVRRDAEILHAVALMHQFEDDDELGSRIEEPADQFVVILEASRLKGVLAARLYAADGTFVGAFPEYVSRARPEETDLKQLKALRPVSHFQPATDLASLFKKSSQPANLQAQPVPLLDVLVPLYRQGRNDLLGIAQFILDGQGIAMEFTELDRHLYVFAAAAFAGGTLIIVVALLWAFRRLQQTNRLLRQRTASLLNANHQLALAARTSALGAVTAHLIHGLRSPLSGLHSFVTNRTAADAPIDDSQWQDAMATTRRMQTLISDIVRLLNEHDGLCEYEITFRELAEMIRTRTEPAARAAGVQLQIDRRADGLLLSRQANLILLILENLIDNAVRATPPGQSVKFCLRPHQGAIVCEVRDEGPGFPETLRSSLFSPCQSSKHGGSGIGLAISKQLANHLGAALELKSSSTAGCVFTLTLPAHLLPDRTATSANSDSIEPITSTANS
jgi:signal transduction histidine kinase